MDPNITCSNCLYWSPQGRDSGFCHRYPPVPFMSLAEPAEARQIHSAWPPTKSEQYCGEHSLLEVWERGPDAKPRI